MRTHWRIPGSEGQDLTNATEGTSLEEKRAVIQAKENVAQTKVKAVEEVKRR